MTYKDHARRAADALNLLADAQDKSDPHLATWKKLAVDCLTDLGAVVDDDRRLAAEGDAAAIALRGVESDSLRGWARGWVADAAKAEP